MTGNLSVIKSAEVSEILASASGYIKELVRHVYRDVASNQLPVPQSSFLRPNGSDGPERLIAKPGLILRPFEAAGVKWIGSFPSNRERALPRATGAIILNSLETGIPYAYVDAGKISAVRTAASAAVGAETFFRERRIKKLVVVGAGRIAVQAVSFLLDDGWSVEEVSIVDPDEGAAKAMVARLEETHNGPKSIMWKRPLERSLEGADCALIATTEVRPHLQTLGRMAEEAVVLHMSLRDLLPETLMGATNIVDDRDEAIRENTSLGLAVSSDSVGVSDVVNVGDVLLGNVDVGTSRRVVYAPFGLAALDIGIACMVYRVAQEAGLGLLNDFVVDVG